jgi:hypothetical protein
MSRTGNVNTVTFGTVANRNFTLEYSATVAITNGWTPIDTPTTGDDYFQSVEDVDASGSQRFYRVRMTPP